MKTTTHIKQPDRENAQGLVEFALILPVLLLIVLGLIETGRLIFIYSNVTNAAREAARYGSATGNSDNGIPRFMDCDEITNAAVRVGFLGSVQPGDVTITYDNGPGTASLGGCPPNNAAIQTGTRIVIEVESTFDTVVPGLLPFGNLQIGAENARTIIRSVNIDSALPPGAPTNTPTNTSTSTPTETNTPTATFTPSNTPTITLTPIYSYTPSLTPTITLTPTLTLTFTPTATSTLTPTATNTVACTASSGTTPARVGTTNGIQWDFLLLAGQAQDITSIVITFDAPNSSNRLTRIDLNGTNIYFSSGGLARGTRTITFNPAKKVNNFDGETANVLLFIFDDASVITISNIQVNFANSLCPAVTYP